MNIETSSVVNLFENIAGFEVPPELLGRDPILDDVVAPPFDVTPYLAAAHYGEQLSLLALLRQRPVERMRSVSDVISADLFAGGGGASLGIELATGRSPIVAVNHDWHAIQMHMANHPLSIHFHKDVWEVPPQGAVNGAKLDLLHASPDCRDHSRAKGGKPRDKDIRALAWVIVEWAYLVRPTVITGENVPEFVDWGPLWPDTPDVPEKLRNKRIAKRKGEIFDAFKLALGPGCPETHPAWSEIPERVRSFAVKGCGYTWAHRKLVAARYGVPTLRERLYFVARCDGEEIRWPEPTHGPGLSQPYRTAAECLDFDEPCLSIFATPAEAKAWSKEMKRIGHKLNPPQRPLAMPTERRIAEGLRRFVLNNPDPFIITTGQQSSDGGKVRPVGAPPSTIVTKAEHCLVTPVVEPILGSSVIDRMNQGAQRLAPILTKFYGTSKVGATVEAPMPTSTAQAGGGHLGEVEAVLAPVMLRTDNQSDGHLRGIADPSKEPVRTITSAGGHAIAEAVLVCTTHQDDESKPVSEARVKPITGPVPTITGANRGEWAEVEAELSPLPAEMISPLILRAHGKGWDQPGKASGVTKPGQPFPTITATEEWATVAPVLIRYNTEQPGRQVNAHAPNAPLLTQPTENRFGLVSAFMAKHYGGVTGHGLNRTLGTVTAIDHHSLVEADLVATARNEPPDRREMVAAFLVKYYGEGGQWQPLTDPLHTVVSVARFGLVEVVLQRYVVGGKTLFHGIEIDGCMCVAVVLDGVVWIVTDIRLRMLTPRELARAQGFPEDYILTGTKAQQIARIGNSVCPPVIRAIVEANFGPRRNFQAAA